VHSTPAVLLRLGDFFGVGAPRTQSSFGSDNVVGAGGALLIAAGTLAIGLVLLALTVRLHRALSDQMASTSAARWSLVAGCFGAVVATVVLGKVLSPQFLIWQAPVLGLLAGRREWRAGGLLLAAMLLTSLDTGATYSRLVDGDGLAIAVVAVRNLLLGALLAELWGQMNTRGHSQTCRPWSGRPSAQPTAPGSLRSHSGGKPA